MQYIWMDFIFYIMQKIWISDIRIYLFSVYNAKHQSCGRIKNIILMWGRKPMPVDPFSYSRLKNSYFVVASECFWIMTQYVFTICFLLSAEDSQSCLFV